MTQIAFLGLGHMGGRIRLTSAIASRAGRSGRACARISAIAAVERDPPIWQCTSRWAWLSRMKSRR